MACHVDGDRARRVTEALARISDFAVSSVSARFAPLRSIGDAIRAVLLAEDVDALVAPGVPQSKLVSKLRDSGQFEATWAEIRCAALAARRCVTVSESSARVGDPREPTPIFGSCCPKGRRTRALRSKRLASKERERALLRLGPVLAS